MRPFRARVGGPKAVFFDLDDAVLDRRRAWQYAIEEAVAGITGRRVNAAPLAGDFLGRPWAQALAVLLDDRRTAADVERLCGRVYASSAMKRLLVHEGIGMALDRLRGAGVEMGAVSREPHSVARKQIDSTGLDRFLAVLSPTPAATDWRIADRLADGLAYLGRRADETVFVGVAATDLESARAMGIATVTAGWATATGDDAGVFATPRQMVDWLIAAG